MSKYRKKPVEIEAHQFAPESDALRLAAWCGGEYVKMPDGYEDAIAIDTLEGVMSARRGDWIIRGVNGEFYPCKPDIFAATYEPVGEA